MVCTKLAILYLNTLILVHGFTELSLTAFTVKPESSPVDGKSTWQWIFDELQIVRGTVYDVCDVLPEFVQNVSAIYGVRLITCTQQPRDRPADSKTTADLYFDSQYFNKTQYSEECMEKMAAELQEHLQRKLFRGQRTRTKNLLKVSAQMGTTDVYVYRIKASFVRQHPILEFNDLMTTASLKTSFEARNDLISRWISVDPELHPIAVETDEFSVGNLWSEIYVRVYFEKKKLEHLTSAQVDFALEEIIRRGEQNNPVPGQLASIYSLYTWREAAKRYELSDLLTSHTHACTIFTSKRIQIVRVEGPLMLNGRLATDPGRSDLVSKTREQLQNVTTQPLNNVPTPQSIEYVSAYYGEKISAIYEMYFDSPTPVSIASEFTNLFRLATDGFSANATIHERVENCLVASKDVQTIEYHISSPVSTNNELTVWEQMPSESSKKFQSLKNSILQYLNKLVACTQFASSVIAIRLDKLFTNTYKEVYANLHFTLDRINLTQAIGYEHDGRLIRNPTLAISRALRDEAKRDSGSITVEVSERRVDSRNSRIICGDIFKPVAGILIQPMAHSMAEHWAHHGGHGSGSSTVSVLPSSLNILILNLLLSKILQ